MSKLNIKALLPLLILSFAACTQQGSKIANWHSYSGDVVIEQKVDSVLSLMTLEEKIGQMNQYSANFAPTGEVADNQSGEYLKKGMIGSTFNAFGAENVRMLQEQNMKYSRLKIPMLFAADVIHGLETTFPIPLAEACSWDLDLMEQTARAAAEEATASGVAWNFAPMIDMSNDPRWGRVMEGAGEDVYLATLAARARVKGFQGISNYNDLSKGNTMIATAKHFVGYGAAQGGRDYHTTDISEHKLHETYFPPFKAVVEDGVGSFMTSFNDLNGVPATGNKYLFKDILRDAWGFNGLVVTDYTAIMELIPHGYAKDLKHAAQLSLDAGIDMDMISEAFVMHLKELVEEGSISENQIDVAVARILEMKFLLGLFEDPYRYCDVEREKQVIMNDEYVDLAHKAAQGSMVLLKNDNNVLPLKKDESKRVALIGPFINERESLNGEWAIKGDRDKSVTVKEGLDAKYAGSNVKFTYEKGTDLPLIDRSTEKVSDIEPSSRGFAKAIQTAKNSDVVLVAMGENYHWSGEAASRTDITLPGNQRELLKELKKTGKPIILVVFNGRPLDLSWEAENVDAIVEAWYPGLMAGHAVADIISGDYNPSAKLVMTFPRNVGQVPIFYNQKNTGRPFNDNAPADYRSNYIDVENTPLYSFGHGLSYTNFEYSNVVLNKSEFTKGGSIKASVEVTNTGKFDGEEIVQLYIQDIVASVTRPVKELKGFEKITLKKGESKVVEFTIDEETIEFIGLNNQPTVEAGDFNLWIGTSSDDESNHMKFSYK
ncbi:beta-glucosidase BglX [Carboxylicivirga linearis]|uniref:beta-glucosidase n=1 Tax=Carboxylicivirga linearis TaxID=1628157 RepID=A0ABS5JXT7_9BACT|nr:beta-glucosidase BglX [Carboxylicivirga linearis]MBS2099732.1 beta-glucosidase BglX [Carboxylicivirga linearis]